MARETVFTAIIPAILIFFLVFFNIRKMQKQAKIMKWSMRANAAEAVQAAPTAKAVIPRRKNYKKKRITSN